MSNLRYYQDTLHVVLIVLLLTWVLWAECHSSEKEAQQVMQIRMESRT